MTDAERQRLIQQHVDENRNRFAATAHKPTRQQAWKRGYAIQARQPHALPGKPRSFSVWWIATDHTPDRYVSGDMCYDAAVAVAGAMRDGMSDAACSRGTYLPGRTPREAVSQAGWLPVD